MSGTVITPQPVRKVGRLLGARLRAEVALEDGADFVTGYDIELGMRAEPDSPAWDSPLWRFSSISSSVQHGTSPARPRAPSFVSLAACPAEVGMRIADPRPRVILRAAEPIGSYDWRLVDDLVTVDRGTEVTRGISEDGRWIAFRPGERLRRTGQTRKVILAPGVFRPPFEPPRDRTKRPRRYKGGTYPTHSAESIDFNRGGGSTDKGDPVYAAAKGTVVDIRRENGAVFVSHDGGWVTVYGHMEPIPGTITPGATVTPTTILGRISDKYLDPVDPDATISPHLHHQHILAGTPERMRFDGRAYELGTPHPGFRRPTGRSEALLRVRVTRASDGLRSRFRNLRFEVVRKRAQLEPCLEIDHVYDGEELASGKYSIRYRVQDSRGRTSDWAFDQTVAVAHGAVI